MKRIFFPAGSFILFLSHKPMNVGGIFLGGAIFGIGLPVFLFCPGTIGAALAEGRWHAVFGILGGLIGAGIFAYFYPFFGATVLSWKDYGNIGLEEAFGVSAWIFIFVIWLLVIPLFIWFEKRRL